MTAIAFHLVRSGGLYRLERALHLVSLGRFAALLAAIAWLPLVLLIAVDPRVALSTFWPDVSAHVRCLLGIPLLIAAEPMIDGRIALTVDRYEECLTEPSVARLKTLARRFSRLADAWWLDVLFIAISYAVARSLATRPVALSLMWDRDPQNVSALSLAGFWYTWISLPLLRFLVLRWAWRIVLWIAFLGAIARLPSELSPAHPDGSGGIAFVGEYQNVFTVIAFVASAIVASTWGANVIATGQSAKQYLQPLIALVVANWTIFLGPLLFFSPRLVHARREGKHRFDLVAARVLTRYERNWIDRKDTSASELLESNQPSALIDHASNVQIVHHMRPVLIDRTLALTFLVAVLLPMVPLALHEVPFVELLRVLGQALIR